MGEFSDLAAAALAARKMAYAPYSSFAVGAAIMCENGKIYTGCNVENAAFGPGCCAERTALFKAVSEGERHFRAIAVAGGRLGEAASSLCPPCGVCRQALREFCGREFPVLGICEKDKNAVLLKQWTLSDLLPDAFGPENL